MFKVVNESGHLLNLMDASPPRLGSAGRISLAAERGLRLIYPPQPGFLGALEPLATLTVTVEAEPCLTGPTLHLVPAGGPFGQPLGLPFTVVHLGPLPGPGSEQGPEAAVRTFTIKPPAPGPGAVSSPVAPHPFGAFGCSSPPFPFQPGPPPGPFFQGVHPGFPGFPGSWATPPSALLGPGSWPPHAMAMVPGPMGVPPATAPVPSGTSQSAPLLGTPGQGGGGELPSSSGKEGRPAQGSKRSLPEPAQGGGGQDPSATASQDDQDSGDRSPERPAKSARRALFEDHNPKTMFILSVNNRSGQEWCLFNANTGVKSRPKVEIRSLSGAPLGAYRDLCRGRQSHGRFPIPSGMTASFLIRRGIDQKFKSTRTSTYPILLLDHRNTCPSGTHLLIASSFVQGRNSTDATTWRAELVGMPGASAAPGSGPLRLVERDTLDIVQDDWDMAPAEAIGAALASEPGSSCSSSSSSSRPSSLACASGPPLSTPSIPLPAPSPAAAPLPFHGEPGMLQQASPGAGSLEAGEGGGGQDAATPALPEGPGQAPGHGFAARRSQGRKRAKTGFQNSTTTFIFSINNRSGRAWRLVNPDPGLSRATGIEVRPQVEIRTLSGEVLDGKETFRDEDKLRGVYPIPSGTTVSFKILRQRQNFRTNRNHIFPLHLQDHRHASPSGTYLLIRSERGQRFMENDATSWFGELVGMPGGDAFSAGEPLRMVGRDSLDIVQDEWARDPAEGFGATVAPEPGPCSSSSSSSSGATASAPPAAVPLVQLPSPPAPVPSFEGLLRLRNASLGAWSLVADQLNVACVTLERAANGIVTRRHRVKGQPARIELPAGAELVVEVEQGEEARFQLLDGSGPHPDGLILGFEAEEMYLALSDEAKEAFDPKLRSVLLGDPIQGFTIQGDSWDWEPGRS